MSKRTRVFVLSASAVIIVGLGTAGVASYVNLGQIGLGPSPSDELSYIPANAELVAFVDVRQLLDSELGKTFQPKIAEARAAASDVLAAAGIDITKDVDSLVVAGLPRAIEPPREAPLAFARGRFDFARIESLVTGRGGQITHHNGVRMAASEAIAVAFLDPSLILLGQPTDVQTAIDTRTAAAGAITASEDFRRLADRIDGDHAWAIARFDALRQRAPVPPAIASALPAITWFAAGGRVDDGLAAHVHAEARDEQAARDMRQVVQGLLALVRLQADKSPELAALVNSIELTGEGNAVSVAFSISREVIEKLSVLGRQLESPSPPNAAPLSAPRPRPRVSGARRAPLEVEVTERLRPHHASTL
jgi:hypothetical protein